VSGAGPQSARCLSTITLDSAFTNATQSLWYILSLGFPLFAWTRFLNYGKKTGNRLSVIPPEIGRLAKLQRLYLSCNQFEELPEQIRGWYLAFGHSSVPHGACRTGGIEGSLHRNESLQHLPSSSIGAQGAQGVEPCQLLFLHCTAWYKRAGVSWPLFFFYYVDCLTDCMSRSVPIRSLEVLFLNGNEIEDLPPDLCSLTNLKDLDLSFNCLSTLPAEFTALRRLVEVDLSHNELVSIPAGIKSFQQICQVFIRPHFHPCRSLL